MLMWSVFIVCFCFGYVMTGLCLLQEWFLLIVFLSFCAVVLGMLAGYERRVGIR